MIRHLLLIGTGGFVGAIARYGLSGFVQNRWGGDFPLGTLVVNLVGCFVLGGLMSLVEDHPQGHPSLRSFAGIGILGAFTTFSTFSYETTELLHDRRMLAAGGNILLSVGVGLVAMELGRTAVRLIKF